MALNINQLFVKIDMLSYAAATNQMNKDKWLATIKQEPVC